MAGALFNTKGRRSLGLPLTGVTLDSSFPFGFQSFFLFLVAGIYPADLTEGLKASRYAFFPISIPSHPIFFCINFITLCEEQAGEEASIAN